MKRRVLVTLMAAAALPLLVSACSGGNPPAAPTQATQSAPTEAATPTPSTTSGEATGVTVGKTGYGVSRSTASGVPDYVWAAALVKNATPNISALNVSFSVYGEDGKVLGQSDSSSTIFRSGRESAVGTQIDVPAGSKISKVVVTASELPNLSQRDESPQSAFETTGVEFRPDQYFPKVTGEVVSKYKQSVTEVHVTAVCFDASDGIIGGGETYVTAVGAGQTVGFEVGNLILGESPAKCTAYADLSAISQAS